MKRNRRAELTLVWLLALLAMYCCNQLLVGCAKKQASPR